MSLRAERSSLPKVKGLFDGIAIRGPVTVGSVADIVLLVERKTSVEETDQIFVEEAATDRYRDIIGITEDPIVSSDIIKDPRASIIDFSMTRVVDGDLIKVLSWYDNEWGFTNQMVKEAEGVRLPRQARLRARWMAKSQIPCSLHRYSNRERIWQTARVRNRDVVLARNRLEPIELPWPTRVGCAG